MHWCLLEEIECSVVHVDNDIARTWYGLWYIVSDGELGRVDVFRDLPGFHG